MKNNLSLLLFCLLILGNLTAQEVPNTQKVVVTKITATWCPNCGTAAWDEFETLSQQFKNDAILLGVHPSGSSDLHTPIARQFSNNLPSAFGQPLFYINRNKYTTSSILAETQTAVQSAASTSAIANAGFKAAMNGNQLEAAGTVQFFQETEGDYFLSLYVVENDVIADQANRGSNVKHKNVLRGAFTETAFGEVIASGSIAAETEISFDFQTNLQAEWNPDNLQVAAIIWKQEGDFFEFVNANEVPVTEATSTSVQDLAAEGVNIQVLPNLIADQAVLEVNLEKTLSDVQLLITSITGQEVVRRPLGTLNRGQHQIQLSGNDFAGTGNYWVSLVQKGKIISKKVVRF